MKVLYTDLFIIKLTDSKLQFLNSSSLKESHVIRSPTVTCFSLLNPSTLLFGNQNGSLIKLCLNSFSQLILHSSKNVLSSLFVLDNFIYCGYTDGTIIKFKYSSKLSIFKSFSHTLPILNLISNGEQILVSDMSGKVTSYPSKIVYDLINPIFLFKYYIFISEKNILYCLTHNSLSSYLQTNTKILKYQFTNNGGVLFIMLYDSIIVYDFNNKREIRSIEKSYIDFLYDEKNNWIVGFYEKSKEKIENVLMDEYEEMENVVFEENKIQNRIVKITEDEEYNFNDENYYDEYDEDEYYEDEYYEDEYEEVKKPKKKINSDRNLYNNVKSDKNNTEKNLKNLFNNNKYDKNQTKNNKYDKNKSDKNKYDNNIYDINKSDKNNHKLLYRKTLISDESEEYTDSIPYSSIFPISNPPDTLFFYSNVGYLLSISAPDYNKIELRFHDRSLQNIEFNDFNNCHMGKFLNSTILIYNNKSIFFHGTFKWSKPISGDIIVDITDKLVIIYDKFIRIYTYKGDEIFNFYISDVSYICSDNNEYLFIFSNNLHIIKYTSIFDIVDIEVIYLPGRVQWATFYEDVVYYKIDEDIFILYKKLSYNILQGVKYPLTVTGSKLVCLEEKKKILPVFNIEYKRFQRVTRNLLLEDSISDETTLFDNPQ